MKTFIAVVLAAGLMAAQAECPNACSGHGTCGVHDSCACYDNWMGGDCSQRVCPFGLAFVDTPGGDLNHDGSVSADTNVGVQYINKNVNEVWQGTVDEEAHFYTECSGKGSCDRATGECACYDGYTGSSCQRTTCPNDCSGHGQCFTLREIAAGVNPTNNAHPADAAREVGRNFRVEDYSYGAYETSGVSTVFDYNLWDADKGQACVCDAGFFGVDCSMRDCPRGNDPLTTDIKYCGGAACTNENQYVYIAMPSADAFSQKMFFAWKDTEDYAGLLRPLRTESFIVKSGLTGDDYAELVQSALETFPNGVLSGISVTCNAASVNGALLPAHTQCSTALGLASADWNTYVELKVDFANGPQGNVNDLYAVPVQVFGSTTPNVVSHAAVTNVKVFTTSLVSSSTQVNDEADGVAYIGTAQLPDTTYSGASAITALSDLAPTPTAAPTDGNQENSPCSSRGLCDYTSGTCTCFAGYTREDCSVQSALAM